jgi:hypothetical protein
MKNIIFTKWIYENFGISIFILLAAIIAVGIIFDAF